MDKTVIELFAGVGGFRVGLNNVTRMNKKGQAIENGDFKFVWANQWEPSTKVQHAFDCYNLRFSNDSNNSNTDISLINKNDIPDHTLLCGGFPCQDYSVAHSLTKEKGIEGKKGVLWWQIYDILKVKKPPFVLLENVDRLLKSPAKQRGRDFGIMLQSFNELGYFVQWRVINAAEYGFPQKRRRIYIFASKEDTSYSNNLLEHEDLILTKDGIFSKTFKIKAIKGKISNIAIGDNYKDLVDFSNNFHFNFLENGYMSKGVIYSCNVIPKSKKPIVLKDIIVPTTDDKYYLTDEKLQKFRYLRGKKKIERTNPDGKTYFYSEGAMSPIDDLCLPGRTLLTSESSTNRSTHIIQDPITNKIRILQPIECERLNQFPDNWTNTGMPENRRYFMMGNALVCGVIKKLGKEISKIIEEEK